MLDDLKARAQSTDFAARLQNDKPKADRLRPRQTASKESVQSFWQRLQQEGLSNPSVQDEIADPTSMERTNIYGANIENYIGTVKVPVGLIGPLRVNGLNAAGDYFVPMATSEAALVASYGRGAEIASAAGGVSAAVLSEGVLRTPAFVFDDILKSGTFVSWVVDNAEKLAHVAGTTTRFGKLISIEPFIDVDVVFLVCHFTTGDASGQNMVTVATEAMCRHIIDHSPVKMRHWFIEANFSGDKKASYLGLQAGRGRKVTASVVIPDTMLKRYFRADREKMLAYGRVAALGATLSGQLGSQAHYANGLAAIYLATGQDVACVSESAVGFTRMEPRDDGLFFSVTMPNILVGTVGGGTGLPSQTAALSIMGLKGNGKAAALAEVTAAVCLCGEMSIIAAIASGHFTNAHEKLARLR